MSVRTDPGRRLTIRPGQTIEEALAVAVGILPEPELRGAIVGFKLAVVPEKLRRQAADRICRRLADEGGWVALELAVEIKRRAMFPSDETYWIGREAFEAVMARA